MRVIYSNGTESNLLLRSLQRALYKDEAGRRLTEPNFGPLFADTWESDDVETGTIYVVRSLSAHPYIVKHRELIHKIGVTGGLVEDRIANAASEATFLFADMELIATYRVSGLNRAKLESLFHRIFASTQLETVLHNPYGRHFTPRNGS